MTDAFLFFIAGAFAMRMLQWALNINPNYYVWKHTEFTILRLLADLHVQQLMANQILKLSYEDAGKLEEYDKVKTSIEQKYTALINTSLNNLKSKLPYKVKYNTIKEAAEYYVLNKLEKKDGKQQE